MVTSTWASVCSWLTPTVLFCVLNLMIGTIFIISSAHKPVKKQNALRSSSEDSNPPPQLARAPSLLERVKSINFYRSEHQPNPFPFWAAQYGEHQEQNVEEAQVLDSLEPDQGLSSNHVKRTKSEPSAGAPAARKMKKSMSEKAVVLEGEEEKAKAVDRRRPATVRERKGSSLQIGEDEGVDEKADDFINRFRQQLKLQRLDSLLRYKEMLNRGAGR